MYAYHAAPWSDPYDERDRDFTMVESNSFHIGRRRERENKQVREREKNICFWFHIGCWNKAIYFMVVKNNVI